MITGQMSVTHNVIFPCLNKDESGEGMEKMKPEP